jgi:hypothetical protein
MPGMKEKVIACAGTIILPTYDFKGENRNPGMPYPPLNLIEYYRRQALRTDFVTE